MNLDSKVAKQLGWEMKDGILVTKAAAEPVPCACDECGYVADAVPGAKCPECKTGVMKAKGKEKAIEVREPKKTDKVFVKGKIKGMGPLSDNELRDALRKLVGSPTATAVQALVGEAYVTEIYEDYFLFTKNGLSNSKEELYFSQGFEVADDGEVTLVGEPEAVKRRVVYEPAQKAKAIPCTCDECGAEAECTPGSTCQEPDCDGTMVADKKEKGDVQGHEFHGNQYGGGGGGRGAKDDEKYNTGAQKARDRSYGVGARVATPKGEYGKVVGFDKDGSFAVVRSEDTGKVSSYHNADLQMVDEEGDSDEEDKSFSPEIKVVRPAPSVKVLFVPPSSSEIAQRVGDAVEKALSRRTGKIL
jgi:hypothetical protein